MRSGWPTGSGAEPQRIDLDVPGELWAMMLDTEVMFDRVVRANAADAEQADRIVQNRFFRNMAGRTQWHAGVHGVGSAAPAAR